ncbi:MAG: TIGR04283 family arsenosugar biosynthesis glycosyltransferase [Fibrobacterota bacterium]|nr:TIGR04283 family arsenosugar biosynthesis glycosyltransferase [Fibrobacterota bacterium]
MRNPCGPEDSGFLSVEPEVSVVVPVYREGEGINGFLEALLGMDTSVAFEVLVVDGDGKSTLKHIESPLLAHISAISASQGRGCQMNAGAARARAPYLLFLHADARLPPLALERMVEALRYGGTAAGAFDLAIDSPRLLLRLIARLASLRSRWTRIPYGDQGQFLSRETFRFLGGYREWPLMEDVDLMRVIKARKGCIKLLHEKVTVSARRWTKEGVISCTLRNWRLLILYYLGVPPRFLASYYPPQAQRRGAERRFAPQD